MRVNIDISLVKKWNVFNNRNNSLSLNRVLFKDRFLFQSRVFLQVRFLFHSRFYFPGIVFSVLIRVLSSSRVSFSSLVLCINRFIFHNRVLSSTCVISRSHVLSPIHIFFQVVFSPRSRFLSPQSCYLWSHNNSSVLCSLPSWCFLLRVAFSPQVVLSSPDHVISLSRVISPNHVVSPRALASFSLTKLPSLRVMFSPKSYSLSKRVLSLKSCSFPWVVFYFPSRILSNKSTFSPKVVFPPKSCYLPQDVCSPYMFYFSSRVLCPKRCSLPKSWPPEPVSTTHLRHQCINPQNALVPLLFHSLFNFSAFSPFLFPYVRNL